MASDLNVSIPSAGLLVSLYALGVAIGAPVLTALTGRLNRKYVLLAVMSSFVVGNLLSWLAPSYDTLIVAPYFDQLVILCSVFSSFCFRVTIFVD